MTEPSWYRRSLIFFKRLIEREKLLREHDKVLIAVSGGIDSLVLSDLLYRYSLRYRKSLELLACHLNPGFPGWKTRPLEAFFKTRGIDYLIENIDINERLKKLRKSICYFCARERRKYLFNIAKQYQIKKIAFAHHLDDVNETYLLNLLYSSNSSTFVIKQDFFTNEQGEAQFYIIRPLYYFPKEFIIKYAQLYHIRPIKNRCPYEKDNERMAIRRWLTKMYKKDPKIKSNIFWGIKNIKLKYLP
jgi:tRNA(Ile)-lysidine synthetase-like protein